MVHEKVGVIGGGGREAALIAAYGASPHVDELVAAPGNDLMGINTDKRVKIFPGLKTTNIEGIVEMCRREGVTLVDVAQDNAVEAGLVNALIQAGIPVVGPTKEAGQIEWDKAWAREFGERHDLPQPLFQICFSPEEGLKYLETLADSQPVFIKASFLAEGKGALPARNKEEARERIAEMAKFGKAGEVFLIENWLQGNDGEPGEEFSTFAVSDGITYKVIGSAQDHKTAFNFDEGENTGGMGCSSPPFVMTPALLAEVQQTIFAKTFAGLQQEGRPYKGVLYLGGKALRQNGANHPWIVEFNARWGDPEAQVIVPNITNDFFEVSMAIAQGKLGELDIKTDNTSRVVVAGTSRGYPGNYEAVKGKQIFGLDEVRKLSGVRLYGGGVKVADGKHYAAGGRLFYIVGEGTTVIEARQKAYEAMALVHIEGNNLHYRTDIGWRDVQRLRKYAASTSR